MHIKYTSRYILWCTSLSLLNPCYGLCAKEVVVQAEEGRSSIKLIECNRGNFRTPCIHHRNRAYKGLTLWLDNVGQYLSYKITSLSEQCVVNIADIKYSNDFAGADNISVLLDNILIGGFTTHQRNDSGYLWNVFESSGPIGGTTIHRGEHTLLINVSATDTKGVELDIIVIEFEACETNKCPIVFTMRPAFTVVNDDSDGLSDAAIIGIVYGLAILILVIIVVTCGVYLFRKKLLR